MAFDEGTYGANEMRVIVLLPKSPDAGSILRVLEGMGVTSRMCATSEELCAEIERGVGALMIEEHVLSTGIGACLHALLDRQPSWSELPIIVLLSHGPETQIARDALLLHGDVSLVERPVRVNTLVAVVRSALRSRRRQFVVRDQLLALEQSERRLQKAKDELDVRVQDRTELLSNALEKLLVESTERLQVAEELRRKEQLLMQQNRLAAMGEMLVSISHQWRQPLNVLGLILQELNRSYQRGTVTSEFVEVRVSRAKQVITHMSQTIDDFRNFLNPDKIKVLFTVKDVVETTLSMVEGSFKEIMANVKLIAEDNVFIEGYRNEYAQAVMNILVNARDVFKERDVAHPQLTITISTENGRSVVTFADNAGGIAGNVMGRIFDPYFTTKAPDKGTGIGLFMSKMIIERNMNGSLSVRNTDEGAEFRIEV
ncbi:sensor histidine kinase [Pelotalea chapellei]|uniref:histidine kinase n=1 Tax=Pelotalea chapellei TaxID=44671 RepID=A0ABS5UD41_9BACT|nr:ATP-binding protein [Pelotalea chapellei]MBT1073607.1 hypothetical protein [Pelotalea chapellei]